MSTETAKPEKRRESHIEDVKQQIARCLENELTLLAEERDERARRLGIPRKLVSRPQ